jgi:hypothetical protein
MNLKLKTLELNKIKFAQDSVIANRAPVILVIGKRDAGKSCLTKDLLFHFKDIQHGVVFNSNEEVDHFYSQFVPTSAIHYNFNPSLITDLLNRQQENEQNAVVVLDDCVHTTSEINNKQINQLFLDGPAMKVMSITTQSYPYSLSHAKKEQLDYVFIFRDSYEPNLKRCWQRYGGIFPYFEQFVSVMESLSEFESLVIHVNSKSHKFCEKVFKYKALIHEAFELNLQ